MIPRSFIAGSIPKQLGTIRAIRVRHCALECTRWLDSAELIMARSWLRASVEGQRILQALEREPTYAMKRVRREVKCTRLSLMSFAASGPNGLPLLSRTRGSVGS